MTKIYILIPIYNDWESVSELIKEINFCIKNIEAEFSIIVINDASSNQQNINLENIAVARMTSFILPLSVPWVSFLVAVASCISL